MKNRKLKVVVSSLNYEVKTPKHKVRGFEEIDLKTRSVLGVFPTKDKGKSKVLVFANSVPESFTVGNGTAKAKNTKKPPVQVVENLTGLHQNVKLVDITLLNEGAQIALTTGHKHPNKDTQYLPLKNFTVNGWTVQLLRVFLYRYDQIKNDHFIEVLIQKEKDYPQENPKVVSFYVPTKARNITIMKGDQPYEDTFIEWLERGKEDQTHTGKLREYIYTELFGGRKESDFTDKGAKKYVGFNEMRKLMVNTEKRLGNTTLSVFFAFAYWFWSNNGRDTLENDMIGYYGKKFYNLLSGFMEKADTIYAKPGVYDFSGESEEI